ncbi:MAG: nitrile hydratase subunit alpha [Alphaproteobacteria bacterium]|nr:nitrile hydratase subunit alpha [Alphaproteobacteria bacterium]
MVRTRIAVERQNALAPPIPAVHADHHGHDHDHTLSDDAARPLNEYEVIEETLREVFIEKGFFTAADLQRTIADAEGRRPALGAKFIARAWTDPAFLRFALADALGAAEQIGIDMKKAVPMLAIANTPGVHHLVVCSLCSCYPRPLLGPPPSWYKSRAYRAKAVMDPRGVLREFGTELPSTTRVRVVDSTADLRYLVIPQRPAGTENWPAERLEPLVTRDSMIGVALPLKPVSR